jgi:hypothetical protein
MEKFAITFHIASDVLRGPVIDACKKLDVDIIEGEIYKVGIPYPNNNPPRLVATLVCFTNGRVYITSAVAEPFADTESVIIDDYR